MRNKEWAKNENGDKNVGKTLREKQYCIHNEIHIEYFMRKQFHQTSGY